MMTLILATFLTATPAPTQTAQFRPCVWPNTCSAVPAAVEAPVVQIQTCQWPNRCATVAAAQFQPCVWPNKCG